MKFITIIFFLFTTTIFGQKAFVIGDDVNNLPIKNLINFSKNSGSLKDLQGTITIIDFFGTWCAPCLKALPELNAYKNKFKNDIGIILISTEEESKLTKFISSRQAFIFPVVVDEDNLFTNAFNPPSYPYTIVLDKNFKILSITNAADLTELMLEKFIEVSKKSSENIEIKIENTNVIAPTNPSTKKYNESSNTLIKLSQNFMYAAKTNEDVTTFINELSALKFENVLSQLKNDNDKKAFWINLYNAYTNSSLHKNSDQYKNRNTFFKQKNIIVAGKTFSLDKIEHDILRRGKIKWCLGYLSKIFLNKTAKQLRVDTLDYRIHFALNCGAKSCPPIAFYNTENLSDQLNVAATAYFTAELNYDSSSNVLKLPAILSWFRRDFGGKKNMINILKEKQLLPLSVTPKIKFKKYDWTLYLDNYK